VLFRGSSSRNRVIRRFVAVPAFPYPLLDFSDRLEDPLLDEIPQRAQHELDDHQGTTVSISDLWLNVELRRPLVVVSTAMISQQVSGKIFILNCYPTIDDR
jgi:hypothetical protein